MVDKWLCIYISTDTAVLLQCSEDTDVVGA